jgi:adenylate cyclase
MTNKSLRVGSFTLDLDRLCLRGPSGQADLRPKSFEVLRYLIERAGRVVTKEEMLNAIWPDVTVGDESLTQCISEVRRALSDTDQQIIKTIPRRGYLIDVQVSPKDVAVTQSSQATATTTSALPLPDKPSIAVLPFTNMSGDPEQEYFADGIVDDIITELSRFGELLVIARNSCFQYKGKAIDIRQVGRELGVRYVLEGSIRRSGERIRIVAQLVDADTGGHRWAERYDRKLQDIFAVQDEVVRTIVAILAAHVKKAETERSLTKTSSSWQAYDYYLHAVDSFASYMSSFSAKDLYEARRLLQHSLSIDPNYARSYCILADTHATAWNTPLDKDFLNYATLERAYEFARKAVQLDRGLPQAHASLGVVLSLRHKHDAAISEFERAIALNPNFADFRFGLTLIYGGEAMRAIEVLQAYMRLDPFYAPLASGYLGSAHYMLKQYSVALPLLQTHVSRAPNHRAGHVWLAAAYARLCQFEEAGAAAAEVLRLQPNYTIEDTQRKISKFKHGRDDAHFFDGIRKAGLPPS